MTKLKLLQVTAKTFTLGIKTKGGGELRDTRFAAEMPYREAVWLLGNEDNAARRAREVQKPERELQ